MINEPYQIGFKLLQAFTMTILYTNSVTKTTNSMINNVLTVSRNGPRRVRNQTGQNIEQTRPQPLARRVQNQEQPDEHASDFAQACKM